MTIWTLRTLTGASATTHEFRLTLTFDCQWVTRSSVVTRLCYDSKEQYVIVGLGSTYYHYCEVPAEIVTRWREADSMGRYYDAQVKGRFDCRVNRTPTYPEER